MAGLLDELVHITPGIARTHEVRGVHFSKWGEGSPEALLIIIWGTVVDMVECMEPAPCQCHDLVENHPSPLLDAPPRSGGGGPVHFGA